jgi:phosphoribosyl 1,2-cyclic phosphodiesterase
MLHLHDPAGNSGTLRQRMLGQMVPEYCPVAVRNIRANIISVPFDQSVTIEHGIHVETIKQPHPGGSWGYAFEHAEQRIVYATDSELDALLLDPQSTDFSPRDDRRFPPELLAFFEDTDLLIADAQYTDEEYEVRRGWGHARFSTVVDLAMAARAKQLALFHHDPLHSDAQMDRIVTEARNRAREGSCRLEIFAAEEGSTVQIGNR